MEWMQKSNTAMSNIYLWKAEYFSKLDSLIEKVETTEKNASLLLNKLTSEKIYHQLLESQEAVESAKKLIKNIKVIAMYVTLKGIVLENEKGQKKGILGLSNVNIFGDNAHDLKK